MGQKMIEMGAVSNCVRDEPCRAFLVSATKAIRSVPAEDLKHAYQDKAELDLDQARQNTAAELRKRVVANVGQVSAEPAPALPQPVTAAPIAADARAPGSGEVIDFARDADKNLTFQLVKLPSGAREIQRRAPEGVTRLASVMGREGKWLVEGNDGSSAEAVDIQLTARGFVAGTREKIFPIPRARASQRRDGRRVSIRRRRSAAMWRGRASCCWSAMRAATRRGAYSTRSPTWGRCWA